MQLPIRHMTLYKHGVGFFERRAQVSGERVELLFRVNEMNDLLKSLTAVDRGGGQVLGIDYATPQSRNELLAGCSIKLGDDRSLRDLLVGLRGRRLRLLLDQGQQATGVLVGLDELPERQPVAASLVSVLMEDTARVQTVILGRVEGIEILDQRGETDLRFFLKTWLTQEDWRQVTIRLSPGEHDLAVSYVAPAPTWRVSYRLVTEAAGGAAGKALLLGWGIFDNQLEEDLDRISLALVAGMPVSFVYDLYNPFTPDRPTVREEARVAAAPVEFAKAKGLVDRARMRAGAAMPMAAPAMDLAMAPSREEYAEAAPPVAEGEAMGELFQYSITTPVSVERGRSAMVPIVSCDLDYRKDLIYNSAKLAAHPVATLRLANETGLTLERGPVTVLDRGEYVGEALLAFTAAGGELVIPYAVELGIKIREESGVSRESRGLQVQGAFLHFEDWDIRWREYLLSNNTAEPKPVLIEHPRTASYALFDTEEPREQTDRHWRFEVVVAAQGEARLRVRERSLVARREELRRQSYAGLQRYLRQGLLDPATHDRVAELLALWEEIAANEERLKQLEADRQKLYKAQQQVQGNMGALSTTGKEGALRSQYVEQLQATEEQLAGLARREAELRAQNEQIEGDIAARLKALE